MNEMYSPSRERRSRTSHLSAHSGGGRLMCLKPSVNMPRIYRRVHWKKVERPSGVGLAAIGWWLGIRVFGGVVTVVVMSVFRVGGLS
jgi:hypothetical protein